MEKILYEYSFNIKDFLSLFIFLIVGAGFLINSFSLVKSEPQTNARERFIDNFFKYAGFVIGPLMIGLFILSAASTAIDHFEYKNALKNDDVYVVEGYVENFHEMPYEGHDTEHFEINGVRFEYTDYVITNGYHKTASYGGVITKNGQHLKIKYVVEEYEEETINVILYIAEIS